MIWEGTDTESDPYHKAKNTIDGGNIIVHKNRQAFRLSLQRPGQTAYFARVLLRNIGVGIRYFNKTLDQLFNGRGLIRCLPRKFIGLTSASQ
jgi:hypothetical protein